MDDKPTVAAGEGLLVAERRAAGEAVRRAHFIGCITVRANHPAQALGELVRCARGADHFLNGLPDLITELDRGNVLGKVIQAPDQAEGIPESRQRGCSQTGSHAQPVLFPDLDGNAIFDSLDGHGCRRMAPGSPKPFGGNLDNHPVVAANFLRPVVALIEASEQFVANVVRSQVAMKNLGFHSSQIIFQALDLSKSIR